MFLLLYSNNYLVIVSEEIKIKIYFLQIVYQTLKQLYYTAQSQLIGDAVNLSTNDKTLNTSTMTPPTSVIVTNHNPHF